MTTHMISDLAVPDWLSGYRWVCCDHPAPSMSKRDQTVFHHRVTADYKHGEAASWVSRKAGNSTWSASVP